LPAWPKQLAKSSLGESAKFRIQASRELFHSAFPPPICHFGAKSIRRGFSEWSSKASGNRTLFGLRRKAGGISMTQSE